MLYDIIQNNYACVIVCLLFLGYVVTDKSFENRVEAMFAVTIGIILCLTLVDSLELVQAQLPYPTLARSIFSAIGYALRPASAIMIVFIMHRNSVKKHSLTASLILLLPFAANLICSVVSIFNGCVFYYTDANVFVRGALGMLPFITAGFYVVCMVVATLASIRARNKEETMIIFLIAALSVGGTLMESIFQFDGTLNTTCAIGAVFYYLYLHVSIYSTDPLTGVYSRRIFYLDMEKLGKAPAAVVGIDLNDLKQINDFQGHAAGDKALITMVATIRRNLPGKCTFYRTGGDEFAILCKNTTMDEVEALMRRLTAAMSETPYSFAYGCAAYNQGDDVDKACNEADTKMYIMKTNMKASMF